MDMKKKIAIMYDFDGTLAPINMQEYSFIPEVKMEPSEFWTQCSELSKQSNMDSNLAYMYLMTLKAKEKGFVPVDSVNKDLTILVVADINSTSSKTTKAKKLGIKIISEQEFFNMK